MYMYNDPSLKTDIHFLIPKHYHGLVHPSLGPFSLKKIQFFYGTSQLLRQLFMILASF